MARPTTKSKEREFLDKAMSRLKNCVDADDHNRKAGCEVLKFVNGDQWDPAEKKRRSDKGRPALQINLLDKFGNQVVSDMLQNCPSIKVHPIDSKGDVNIAKIRQGIISNVEYLSNSRGIYGYGARQQVCSGYGAWRVLTRYTEENPFIQEIYLQGIRNPFLVYMDPDSKDQNYGDAKFGFVLEKMSQDVFKERWPNADMPSKELKTGPGLGSELWYEKDTVTVAEYFTVETEKVTMHQLEDGRVISDEEFKEMKETWKKLNEEMLKDAMAGPPPKAPILPPQVPPMPGQPTPNAIPMPTAPMPGQPQPPQMGGMAPGSPQPNQPKPPSPVPNGPDVMKQIENIGEEPKSAKTRTTEKNVVKHRIITCCEILEGNLEGEVVAGKFIPIILLKGRELNIEGKNYVYSLFHHARDPQKMINYWNTSAAETIALAPKAPWLGTPKQFEGFEKDYAAANVENFPMLKYNPDPEAQGPPVRQQPGQAPVALFEQIRRGEENLKSVIGMYNADVGGPTSAQTGAAVNAQQRPGDIGTFEFGYNLGRAIEHTGRIINGMIPKIYDSERDIRLRNVDDSETFVPVNTTLGSAEKSIRKSPDTYHGILLEHIHDLIRKNGKDAKFNDITVGDYDVVISTGPNYATQRQESAQHLLQLVQAMPQQMAIASDLIVGNMDFQGADELASRLRKTLPPGMVKPRPGEQLPQPQPNPQQIMAQMKMQVEQSKQQLAQMKLEQEKIKLEHEKVKLQLELAKAKAEMGKPEEGPDPIEAQEKMARLNLEMKRLELEVTKLEHQQEMDKQKFELEDMKMRHQFGKDFAEHSFNREKMEEENEIKRTQAKRVSK